MELKSAKAVYTAATTVGFNRTYMELKLHILQSGEEFLLRFNRTYME